MLKPSVLAIAVILFATYLLQAQPVGQVSPSKLNFGVVFVGTSSPQMEVALKNVGDANMTVTSVATTGPFAVAVNKCEKGIKAGTHCNVWVTYTPDASETDTGTLTFNDNASNSPQTVSLTGSGITFQTLFYFSKKKSGEFPLGGLVVDVKGNMYGTTYEGGTSAYCRQQNYAYGCGTVFKLTPKGLHSFLASSTDGAFPYGNLIFDAEGNLYGTTSEGGTSGLGTVYTLTPAGEEIVLHSFTGGDGFLPSSGLIMDSAGNLYGTTGYGGSGVDSDYCFGGCGTVFKLMPSGAETVLYNFCSVPNCADGANPYAGLILDRQGNLYGTTRGGGNPACSLIWPGCGTVFKLSPTGMETTLYTFAGAPDGANPYSDLVMDAEGNLYGTTVSGGAQNAGTVFEMTSSGIETVLYAFCSLPHCTDGATPYAGMLIDLQGNLYGTTAVGGTSPNCNVGCGTVFKVTPNGTEIVLHSFGGGADGAGPLSDLGFNTQGLLYGTTAEFGVSPCGDTCGTVFKVTP
jgi:uncharacterized repeat protein (TIGR03803 family)